MISDIKILNPAGLQTGELFDLTEEQQRAFDMFVKEGKNVHLTGEAGTGKSYVIKAVKAALGTRLALTASTGIAAINVGGTTLHSWSGIGANSHVTPGMLEAIAGNSFKRQRILGAKFLIIEEVSMISADLLDAIDEILSHVRDDPSPFGGMNVMLVGDPLQLPPVIKREKGKPKPKNHFYFQSEAYFTGEFHDIKLTVNHRQGEVSRLSKFLNELRTGRLSKECIEYFEARVDVEDDDPSTSPVHLYSTNKMADRYNLGRLKEIEEESFTYNAKDEAKKDFLKDQLDKYCTAPTELVLKKGAQVMLLKNLDLQNGLVNGAVGRVTDLDDSGVEVMFKNFPSPVVLGPEAWELSENGEVYARREQIPLRLAWGITIHKSQGMTLDKIYCRLDRLFEAGQGYVAISRVRTYEGLFLNSFDPDQFFANDKALEFYESF